MDLFFTTRNTQERKREDQAAHGIDPEDRDRLVNGTDLLRKTVKCRVGDLENLDREGGVFRDQFCDIGQGRVFPGREGDYLRGHGREGWQII